MGAFLNVLHSPKQTFERIRDNGGAFLIPFILLIVISIVGAFLALPAIEKQAEEQALTQPEVSAETFKTVAVVSSMVMTPIMIAAGVFITGLLLMLVNLIVRGEAKYMGLVKVAILSSIPSLIHSLITGVLARTADVSNINELTISLGAFLEQKSGFLFGLASIVNPFGIWSLAIMVIGTAVMARKRTSTVAIWIIGGYLLINIPLAILV